jgi:hypothetical protein
MHNARCTIALTQSRGLIKRDRFLCRGVSHTPDNRMIFPRIGRMRYAPTCDLCNIFPFYLPKGEAEPSPLRFLALYLYCSIFFIHHSSFIIKLSVLHFKVTYNCALCIVNCALFEPVQPNRYAHDSCGNETHQVENDLTCYVTVPALVDQLMLQFIGIAPRISMMLVSRHIYFFVFIDNFMSCIVCSIVRRST